MEVITCHIEADFDALASMAAAHRLYPDAKLVFPGAQEKAVRTYTAEGLLPDLPIVPLSSLDTNSIRRLIVVDTRRADRIGALGAIATRPDVELHVYDHHPSAAGDLRGTVDLSRPVGANTTLMLEILDERRIAISPEEATLFLLGLYQETGCLIHVGTRPEDCDLAARLLRAGADLGVISRFLPGDFDAAQVALLDDLLGGSAPITVEGAVVALSQASRESHIEGLGEIATRALSILGARSLFVMVRMVDRVFVTGRSRDPAVDCARALAVLGGGGHPAAAAATVKDRTLIEVREALLASLHANVTPSQRADDCMTAPVETIGPDTRVSEAVRLLKDRPFDNLPVVRGDRILGVISRQTLERAIHHGLGKAPVAQYMATEFATVGPDAPVAEAASLMAEHHQRVIPVLRDGSFVGVLTRQDLLLAERERQADDAAAAGGGGDVDRLQEERTLRTRDLGNFMRERLSRPVLDLLQSLGKTAEDQGMCAYVVGGFVRDLLLGVEDTDIDIVVEGDGIALARAFAAKAGGSAKLHEMFGTAAILLAGQGDRAGGTSGFHIDIATARREQYARPGALPEVEHSSLERDLHRRDFTINTLAICLEPARFGQMLDFFGGQGDLKDRQIRVLHALSFVEDPTRAFRALRFEQRFHFRIGKFTERLLHTAARHLDAVSGPRILNEFVLILEEPQVAAILRRLDAHGLLAALAPGLVFDDAAERRFSRVSEVMGWFRLLYTDERIVTWLPAWLALTAQLDKESVARLATRIDIRGEVAEKMISSRRGVRDALRALAPLGRGEALAPSAIGNALRELPVEGVLWLMITADKEAIRKAASRFLTEWRHLKPELSGSDIVALGIPQGPRVGEALRALRDARLDGRVRTREQEVAHVRTLLGSDKFR